MNLFEDRFTKCDISGGCGESGIKIIDIVIIKLESFVTNSCKTFDTHVVYCVLL